MRRSSQSVVCVALALLAPLLAVQAASAAQLVGPFDKSDYPQALIDRPLTLPAGMVEGELGFQFLSQQFDEPIFEVRATDDFLADVALRVGVTDRIQVEAGTSFSLAHQKRADSFRHEYDFRPALTSWQRVVPLRLSLLALDTEAVDTAVRLTLPFVAHAEREVQVFFGGRGGSRPVTTSNGDGRVLPVVQLDAPTRWRLCDHFWLRAGENLFSVTTGNGTAAFAFVFGIGVQPHPMFAVTLDSEIAAVAFDGDGEEASRTIADDGNIDLEATFSPFGGRVDFVGALVAPDVGLDDYLLRAAARVRF